MTSSKPVPKNRTVDPRWVFGGLWLAFFFHGMTPGFWVPALTNILKARGMADWVPAAFLVAPVCTLVSPLIGGALADQKIPADRLFAWASVLSAVILAGMFACLDLGLHPIWFVVMMGLYSLFSGPTWGLIATISLAHLSHGERQFPLVRVGATIGWVVAGLLTSYVLHADTGTAGGYASAVARVLAGLIAFALPHTPPLGSGGGLKSRLGLDAFSLMKQRDHCVFFVVTTLFSIPLSAFYMYAPEQLKVLGDTHPTGTMTSAQILEVLGMFLVSFTMSRFRVKTLLLWALGLSVVRFGMSAYAGVSHQIAWHIAGIALHGICYTLYFITAQVFLDRRVDPGLKGQAQGLLAMVSAGIGPLVGTVVCGWLRLRLVGEDGSGWQWFWGILAVMIAVCFAIFAAFYQGRGGKSAGVDAAGC